MTADRLLFSSECYNSTTDTPYWVFVVGFITSLIATSYMFFAGQSIAGRMTQTVRAICLCQYCRYQTILTRYERINKSIIISSSRPVSPSAQQTARNATGSVSLQLQTEPTGAPSHLHPSSPAAPAAPAATSVSSATSADPAAHPPAPNPTAPMHAQPTGLAPSRADKMTAPLLDPLSRSRNPSQTTRMPRNYNTSSQMPRMSRMPRTTSNATDATHATHASYQYANVTLAMGAVGATNATGAEASERVLTALDGIREGVESRLESIQSMKDYPEMIQLSTLNLIDSQILQLTGFYRKLTHLEEMDLRRRTPSLTAVAAAAAAEQLGGAADSMDDIIKAGLIDSIDGNSIHFDTFKSRRSGWKGAYASQRGQYSRLLDMEDSLNNPSNTPNTPKTPNMGSVANAPNIPANSRNMRNSSNNANNLNNLNIPNNASNAKYGNIGNVASSGSRSGSTSLDLVDGNDTDSVHDDSRNNEKKNGKNLNVLGADGLLNNFNNSYGLYNTHNASASDRSGPNSRQLIYTPRYRSVQRLYNRLDRDDSNASQHQKKTQSGANVNASQVIEEYLILFFDPCEGVWKIKSELSDQILARQCLTRPSRRRDTRMHPKQSKNSKYGINAKSRQRGASNSPDISQPLRSNGTYGTYGTYGTNGTNGWHPVRPGQLGTSRLGDTYGWGPSSEASLSATLTETETDADREVTHATEATDVTDAPSESIVLQTVQQSVLEIPYFKLFLLDPELPKLFASFRKSLEPVANADGSGSSGSSGSDGSCVSGMNPLKQENYGVLRRISMYTRWNDVRCRRDMLSLATIRQTWEINKNFESVAKLRDRMQRQTSLEQILAREQANEEDEEETQTQGKDAYGVTRVQSASQLGAKVALLLNKRRNGGMTRELGGMVTKLDERKNGPDGGVRRSGSDTDWYAFELTANCGAKTRLKFYFFAYFLSVFMIVVGAYDLVTGVVIFYNTVKNDHSGVWQKGSKFDAIFTYYQCFGMIVSYSGNFKQMWLLLCYLYILSDNYLIYLASFNLLRKLVALEYILYFLLYMPFVLTHFLPFVVVYVLPVVLVFVVVNIVCFVWLRCVCCINIDENGRFFPCCTQCCCCECCKASNIYNLGSNVGNKVNVFNSVEERDRYVILAFVLVCIQIFYVVSIASLYVMGFFYSFVAENGNDDDSYGRHSFWEIYTKSFYLGFMDRRSTMSYLTRQWLDVTDMIMFVYRWA